MTTTVKLKKDNQGVDMAYWSTDDRAVYICAYKCLDGTWIAGARVQDTFLPNIHLADVRGVHNYARAILTLGRGV